MPPRWDGPSVTHKLATPRKPIAIILSLMLAASLIYLLLVITGDGPRAFAYKIDDRGRPRDTLLVCRSAGANLPKLDRQADYPWQLKKALLVCSSMRPQQNWTRNP